MIVVIMAFEDEDEYEIWSAEEQKLREQLQLKSRIFGHAYETDILPEIVHENGDPDDLDS